MFPEIRNPGERRLLVMLLQALPTYELVPEHFMAVSVMLVYTFGISPVCDNILELFSENENGNNYIEDSNLEEYFALLKQLEV